MKQATIRESKSGNTSAYDGTLPRYFREIGDYGLLNREEEVQLAERIRRGDEEARQRMITSNLRLVVTIAKGFSSFGIPMEDLVQAGNVGLMTAAVRYDPSFGTKFSSYAACWIKREIRGVLEAGRVVRVPSHVHEKVRAFSQAEREHTRKTGRTATLAELEGLTGFSAQKISRYTEAVQPISSLDAPAGGEDPDRGRPLAERIASAEESTPSGALEERESMESLGQALGVLSARERLIIAGRFGLDGEKPRTLEQLGEKLGLSRERVRQVQQSALIKLREAMEAASLPGGLGAPFQHCAA